MDGHCCTPPLLPKAMPSPWQTLAAATHIRESWAIFVFVAVIPKGRSWNTELPSLALAVTHLKWDFILWGIKWDENSEVCLDKWSCRAGWWQPILWGRMHYGLRLTTLKTKICRQQHPWHMDQPHENRSYTASHKVTMIRAQPIRTHCKSLRMLSSSSTFDLGSAYLLIGCVLTKFKQEASRTGNLCEHLAETKHSDGGGDTVGKRESDALTCTCLPQSTIKGSFCNILVQLMSLLFSHRSTLHLFSARRSSSLPRLYRITILPGCGGISLPRHRHRLSLAFFSPRGCHQHCTLLPFHLFLWLLQNYLLQPSLQCLCFWTRLV